jgi:sortase A
MRNKNIAGIFCIVCGIALLLGALALHLSNRQENVTAEKAVAQVVPQLMHQIQENVKAEQADPDRPTIPKPQLQIPVELLTEEDKKMTEVEIDGYLYIGYIHFPTLNRELPVMSSWSYPQLKIAPCRYTGSVRGEDMVVMAHNYDCHFGPISGLQIGDSVLFVDMDGRTIPYQVVGKDVLPPTAVDEMTSGEFDLTLFTCTYGGASRVTVYCNRTDK